MNDDIETELREQVRRDIAYLRGLACAMGGPERIARLNGIADRYAQLAEQRANRFVRARKSPCVR